MPPEDRLQLELSRALYPGLAAELDGALAQHANGDEPTSSFDAELDSAAAARFADAGLSDVPDTAGGNRLRAALSRARRSLAGTSLVPPEPEAFTTAGVDWTSLSASLEEDPSLEAVVAPFGLGARTWRELFTGGASLALASEVAREFEMLDTAPTEGVISEGIVWTVRLIPATPAPPLLGLNYSNSEPHVALPEMLMMQLVRIGDEAPLLDGGDGRSSFTWLSGTIGGGRLAARHVYDAAENVIRITAREVGSQGPHLGARNPAV